MALTVRFMYLPQVSYASTSLSSLTLVVLVAVACGGGGDGAIDSGTGGGTDAGSGVGAGDGYHRILVPQDGATDEVWIYASSPSTPGPHPVVVYAHGQGASNLINCDGSGRPEHDDVPSSVAFADAMAAEGYLGVAVFYRHLGDGAPTREALKFRDHFVHDARTLLRAAQWARMEHGGGSDEVAFVGGSMGTYPAFFAGTARPEWSDLQQGLEIRLIVVAGMFLNHLANSNHNFRHLVDAADDASRLQAVGGATLAVSPIHAGHLGMSTIVRADLDPGTSFRQALSSSLQPITLDFYQRLFFVPPEELGLAGCDSSVDRAYCDPDCASALILDAFSGRTNPVVLEDWLTADALEFFRFWDPATGPDPSSASPDSLLGIVRDLSPVYLDHTMVVPKVLPLLSSGDHTFIQQGQVAADRMAELLLGLGVTTLEEVPTIDSDGLGDCGHSDYFLPARPACGWSSASAALAAAFDR